MRQVFRIEYFLRVLPYAKYRGRRAMTISELKYLIAIADTGGFAGETNSSDVARNLDVTRVSVFRALGRLEKNGLAVKDEKKDVHLTEKGRQLLSEYMKIVQLLRMHLVNFGKLEESVAEGEAMKMACVMSDYARGMVIKAFDNGRPQWPPFGNNP